MTDRPTCATCRYWHRPGPGLPGHDHMRHWCNVPVAGPKPTFAHDSCVWHDRREDAP